MRRHPGNHRAQQRGARSSTSSRRPPAFWWDSAPRTLLHFQQTRAQHKVEERRPYFPNAEVLGQAGRVTCSLTPQGESLWPAGFSELVLAPGEGGPAAGFEHRHTHTDMSANWHGSIYSLLREFTKCKGSKATNTTITTHASRLTIPSQGTRNASPTFNPGTPNYLSC